MIRNFQDLQVWQKAHQLVLEVYRLSAMFPSDERYGLISQMRRSAASVCANIAEGNRKRTNEYLRYLEIARGSLEETKYHLILSKDLGYCNESDFKQLFSKADEIGKMRYCIGQNLRT